MMRKKQDREAHVASKKLCKDVFERAARLMAGPGAAGRRKALHTGAYHAALIVSAESERYWVCCWYVVML